MFGAHGYWEQPFNTFFWNSTVCVIDIGAPNLQVSHIFVTVRDTFAVTKVLFRKVGE